MCELEYDLVSAVWAETERTARKPHRCSACGATIEPGQRYTVHFDVLEGQACFEKVCALCATDRKAFAAEHDGINPVPSGFEDALVECVAWDDESRARWAPALEALRQRREAAR